MAGCEVRGGETQVGVQGLIDVGGLAFDELAVALSDADLRTALDNILRLGQSGQGYHGFSNHI